MKKIQRFGGAMFSAVVLFAFAGMVAGVCAVFMNPLLMGSIADEATTWYKIWSIVAEGAWTVFRHMPLVFAIALPIQLANKENARACMESLVLYLTFNSFLCQIFTLWGSTFGVDFAAEGAFGVTQVAGIRTLDMGIFGALVVAGIVVWIHNHFYDAKLPEYLSIFKGSSLVFIIGFVVMIPLAFLSALIWPQVQNGIAFMQEFLATSGAAGVGIYAFLGRILVPTGLHIFIYAPFIFDNIVVQGGIFSYWVQHLPEFATNIAPLKEQFPQGGFALSGMEKVFGSVGISLAIYSTAKPEKKKRVAGLLIPATLTAMFVGITEPLEFTFLFVAPLLFVVYAILSGLLNLVAYTFGVVGFFVNGLIDWVSLNWLPLGANHGLTYVIQIIVGLIFTGIYFLVFRFLILKFNFKTPGREEDNEETKLYTQVDYEEKKANVVRKN